MAIAISRSTLCKTSVEVDPCADSGRLSLHKTVHLLEVLLLPDPLTFILTLKYVRVTSLLLRKLSLTFHILPKIKKPTCIPLRPKTPVYRVQTDFPRTLLDNLLHKISQLCYFVFLPLKTGRNGSQLHSIDTSVSACSRLAELAPQLVVHSEMNTSTYSPPIQKVQDILRVFWMSRFCCPSR
jgi:hypothetical protein